MHRLILRFKNGFKLFLRHIFLLLDFRSMNKVLALIFLFILSGIRSYGQETHQFQDNAFKRHHVSLMWGNTIVPAAKTAHGEDCSIIMPAWGLNYAYHLNRKWAIGWHNELELQSYVVEKHQEFFFEREYPFITSLAVMYEPIHRLIIHAGPGYEIETNENFVIMKAGMEYLFPLPKYYNLAVGFSYDNKGKIYDAWTFGISVGKSMGRTH